MIKQRIAVIYKRFGVVRLMRYAAETFVVGIALLFFRLLSVDTASALGGKMMRIVGPHLKRSKDVAAPQIERAFPGILEQEKEKLVSDMWANLGRIFAEYAHLDSIADRVTMVGEDILRRAHASGHPVILHSAHLGNWEIVPVVMHAKGINMHVLYRAPNNPWVDKIIQWLRRTGAQDRQIAKGVSGAREILSVLKRKGTVGFLVDQKMTGGPMIPFMGRPASTAPAIASFALKCKAQIVGLQVERLAGAYFRMTVLPPLELPDTGDHDADIKTLLTAVNGQIESWVRAHPAQWLWTHRRWEGSAEE